MQARRAILVNGSRLMRELVKRAIEKRAGFKVVKELSEIQELSSDIKDTNAEWAFLIFTSTQEIPDNQKIELLLENPALQTFVLRVGDEHIDLEWLAHEHKDITGMTLDELTHLLRQELRSYRSEDNDEEEGD
jgi:hypothetical protein